MSNNHNNSVLIGTQNDGMYKNYSVFPGIKFFIKRRFFTDV